MVRFIRLLSLPLLIFASTILASGQVKFTQSIFDTNLDGVTPNAIVAADFDKDGILDLVQTLDVGLVFYKGLGGGKFSPFQQPGSQINAGQVVAADFNRDGNVDIAFIPSEFNSGGVTIANGKGDGTFLTDRVGGLITRSIDVGGTAKSITLADFNGDHLPDIAVSVCRTPDAGPCDTKVFLGRGDGTFRLSATLPDGGGQIVAGDFNADGRQDLAVVAGNEVALYLGKGNGTFETPILVSLSHVASLAVGDFFNTHRIQSLVALVVFPVGSNQSSTFLHSLRFSEGHLLVEHQHLLQDHTTNPFLQLAAGDLNGDFKDDVFLTGGNGRDKPISAFMLGNGNGTFQSPAPAPAVNLPPGEGEAIQAFPFVRDLSGNSRHDVGMIWRTGLNGGAEILLNTNATRNCSLPPANALSVHICAPANGQVIGHTFTFRGSGNALNGIAKRMELWIDGKKVAQNLEDQLKATVRLKRGTHVASFVVVDSFDSHVARSVRFKSEF
jgi:VCBS repeat protein